MKKHVPVETITEYRVEMRQSTAVDQRGVVYRNTPWGVTVKREIENPNHLRTVDRKYAILGPRKSRW